MRAVTVAVVVALVVAACGTETETGVGSEEGAWLLETGSVEGEPIPVLADHPITMLLREGEIIGTAACNTYSGQYRASGGDFSLVDGVAVTEMACFPPEAMESQQTYLNALLTVDQIEVAAGKLTLSGSDATTRLVFAVDPDGPPPEPDTSLDPDTPVSSGPFLPSMEGSWELVSGTVDGTPIPIVEGHPITLDVSGDGFGGIAACNHYGAVIDPPPAPGEPYEIFSTAMACLDEGVMESEMAYLAAVERVAGAAEDGDELVLLGEGTELRFRATEPPPVASMTGTVWVLEGLIEGDAVSSVMGEPATLELFTDGSVLGSTGCRTLAGRYEISGADVVFTELTMSGECSDELAFQDNHVTSVLGDGFDARIDGANLTLTSRGHLGLLYRADS